MIYNGGANSMKGFNTILEFWMKRKKKEWFVFPFLSLWKSKNVWRALNRSGTKIRSDDISKWRDAPLFLLHGFMSTYPTGNTVVSAGKQLQFCDNF